jgi:twitching motility protein PilT
VVLGIIFQRLINRASGKGRVAAFEVMVNNSEIGHLIYDGKDSKIEEMMQSCNHGMQTMQQAVDELAKKKIIKEEEHPLKDSACM